MWFRHLRAYQLQESFEYSPDDWQKALAAFQFRPCSPTEKESAGFVPPLGEGTALCYRVGHSILIAVQFQERVLPSAVIKDVLEERVQIIEHETGQAVSAREKRQLKAMIEEELLPKAFCRARIIHAVINAQHNLLAIDTTTAKRAEAILGLLRQAFGSLPVKPWPFVNSPAKMMTQWWQQRSLPTPWSLGDEIEAVDSADIHRKWRYKGFAEEDSLITDIIDDNMLVQKTKLNWHDAVTFVASADGTLTRMQWADKFKEEVQTDDPTEAAAHAFAIMQHQLCALWQDFVDLIEHG